MPICSSWPTLMYAIRYRSELYLLLSTGKVMAVSLWKTIKGIVNPAEQVSSLTWMEKGVLYNEDPDQCQSAKNHHFLMCVVFKV